MELHAFAQLEGPGQPVIGDFPFSRKFRQNVEVVVDINETVVDRKGVIGVVARVHVGGIHRLLFAAPLVTQDFHAFVACGGKACRCGQGQCDCRDCGAVQQLDRFHWTVLPDIIHLLKRHSQFPKWRTTVRLARLAH